MRFRLPVRKVSVLKKIPRRKREVPGARLTQSRRSSEQEQLSTPIGKGTLAAVCRGKQSTEPPRAVVVRLLAVPYGRLHRFSCQRGMEEPKVQCIICGQTAEDITVSTFDGRTFRCFVCGDFDVAGKVFDSGMLQKLDAAERCRALDNAKRSVPLQFGQRPMITRVICSWPSVGP